MSQLDPILDFNVLCVTDLRNFMVADLSLWKHLETEPSYVDIKTPGRAEAVTLNWEKGKVNIFNSSNLGITPTTSVDALITLPDGLYHICVYICEGCKFRVDKYYLRTVHTQLQLDQALIKLDLSKCSKESCYLDKILEANQLLLSAHANAKDGNYTEAVADYDTAKELLDEILECDDCN